MTSADSKIVRFCASPEPVLLFLRLLLIAVVGVAAYSNTFGMSFNFDDNLHIVNSSIVRDLNLTQFFESRRGFGFLTFQVNYFLSGLDVFWYHLTNISIHIFAALLVYAFISLLMQSPYWRKLQIEDAASLPVPLFAALFFVAHPIQTQAVTYIVQRFTSLTALLYLATVVCYLKARIGRQGAVKLSYAINVGWFAVSLSFCILAFKTKEIAYTLPLAILVIEFLFFEINRVKVAFIACAVVAVIVVLLAKLSIIGNSIDEIVSKINEVTRVQTIISRSDYLLTQFRVVVNYLWLLVFPVNQSVEYDYALSHSFFEWRVLGSFLLVLTIFLLSLWLIVLSRNDKPYLRLTAFGILWFFLTLSVESSILPIIDLIFEHRVYLPSVGFFMASCSFVLWLGWKSGNLLTRERVLTGLLVISFVLAGATWKRNLVWTNELTLWEDSTAKRPNNARAWNNLGGEYIKRRDARKALDALIKSIELDRSRAAAWNDLGIAIDLMGVYNDRFHRTVEMFADPRAIEGETVNRWLGDVNNNLGLAYEIMGNLPKAAENYRNAVGYFPALGIAYFNLGLVSFAMKDHEKYSEQLQILRLIDPVLAKRLELRIGEADSRR